MNDNTNKCSENLGGWKYYNHAMLPDCKPHEEANIQILTKEIWKCRPWNKALLAKFTSDWDCEEETGWYWVIQDSPLELDKLKSKKRYEIRKGLKNFYVRPINPMKYPEELFEIAVDTILSYPKAYQILPDKEQFIQKLPTWKFTFGAFDKETKKLCGYIIMVEREEVLYYSECRVLQNCERRNISAALVYSMIDYYRERITNDGAYIVDGERNINHITNHQDFLCSKMGFRKVNVKLHLVYRPGMKVLVNILFPFRRLLKKFDLNHPFIHSINGVMKLEAIVRDCEY